jgi:hypothetical protein
MQVSYSDDMNLFAGGIYLGAISVGGIFYGYNPFMARFGKDGKNSGELTTLEDGILVVPTGQIEKRGVPSFVPLSSVTLYAALSRERERLAPDVYEPPLNETNLVRSARAKAWWARWRQHMTSTDRSVSRSSNMRAPWAAGFRDAVFDGRASQDGKTRCRCCGRVLERSRRAALLHNLACNDVNNYVAAMQLCHVEAHSLGGPNIYVNVWPGDEICNGIMRAQRFTHFACGEWTTPPAMAVPHPVKKPHAITQSPEFKADVVEFDNWFRQWEREGRPDLVPDPTDVRRHL